MKTTILFLIISLTAFSQENTTNEADKKYTLENLIRTRDDLIKATENLTDAQWNFKESPERWSIAMVVEHLGNFELIWARELQEMSLNKPTPELNKTAYGDSVYHKFIMEDKLHSSSTISQPNGYIKNKDNILWFTKLRNDNIKWTENLKVNLRDHFERTNTSEPRNMFNAYIYQWGHVDRHLRQINKVKAHANYPKNFNEITELQAIMKTIEQGTECLYKRDFACWADMYAHKDYAYHIYNNPDGTFTAKVGWDVIANKMSEYIKNNPVQPGGSSHPKVERRNMITKFYGENAAYLTWDQYNSNADITKYKHSKETRIMEKIDGHWKIVNVTGFWDYKNLVPVESLK